MNEYGRLEEVLLYPAGRELAAIEDPRAALHDAPIDPSTLGREFREFAGALRGLGVKVRLIPRPVRPPPNLMYVRDLFFRTPKGALLARMASAARAGEERIAARALARLGVPVLDELDGAARFEGADALWLDPRTVACGVGNRTNAAGLRGLRSALERQGVETLPVKAPRGVLHLLGAVQIVDARLALVRDEIVGRDLRALLKARGFQTVRVPESEEASARQGFNVVAVAPRTIVMPKGCPGLERLYRSAGLRVAARVRADQLVHGAGGLACAAGILARRG